MAYRIALYPGDGIGLEVTDEAVRVLEHARQRIGGFDLEFERFDWGCDYHDRHGVVAPEDFLDRLRPFDAVFLGAVGFPPKVPDHVSVWPIIRLRQGFDLYACVRPAKLRPGVSSPLTDPGRIDMVVVRENSEGEYLASGGRMKVGTPDELAVQSGLHTRRGIERILRFGFELALTRRKRLTMVTKSNTLVHAYVLWDEILDQVAPEFPDVATERQHVDAATIKFVRAPAELDVVVGSNLFGDILTDLSGAITGSLGLNPSANLNPERKFPSLFEPVHGSAPDIAGRGIANPVAAILSAAMMLDWLGSNQSAAAIESAVDSALSDGCATPDLGGDLSTQAMTDKILERIGTD